MISDTTVKRKLTTIFYADVAGYSRLTGEDEMGTHHEVMETLDLATERIKGKGGTVLRYAGDAILAEFPSVVAAAEAAVSIQNDIHAHNTARTTGNEVLIRIGINLGEVLQDRNEIFGDGVNLAARLEAAAAPGGICISQAVYDQLRGRVNIEFDDGGRESFKNIADPVHVYRWRSGAAAGSPATIDLALPSKPSIAVLAFDNMSNDPEQDYFAEGISEDIITELSKFRSFFIIARNSAFAFKGQAIDVKDISRKLGVRYVVEGSVRRAGNRVRITAQLIDAVEDKHLWAERYDRNLDDIFAVQDEVTHAIVTTIEPHLVSTERQRARRKPAQNLDAWECYQRGLWHINQYTEDHSRRALEFIQRAIELDPAFASAHGGLAFSLYVHVIFGISEDRERDLARGLEAGRTAVALDENDPFAHVGLGRIHIVRGEHEQAITAFDRAISLSPSSAVAHYGRAHTLWHCGHPAQAVAGHDEAMRLSPRDPLLWTFMASKAIALVMLERYQEALDLSRKAQQQPITAIWACMGELCALGMLDLKEEAQEALSRAKKLKPDLSISFVQQALPITHAPSRELFLGGLARAGVPD